MNIKSYNVKWDEQSKNASESMPVGGGNIGCNVWGENNYLYLYMQQSGWFDENNSMLKAGRLKIEISPCPFIESFTQELVLEKGCIEINGTDLLIDVWVDIWANVIHVDYQSTIDRKIKVSYESWRTRDREVNSLSYELFQCKEMFFYPLDNITFHKDEICVNKNNLFFYHQNDGTDLSIEKEFKDQGLESYYEQAYNPQKNAIYGGVLVGTNLEFFRKTEGIYCETNFVGYEYVTSSEIREGFINVALGSIYSLEASELESKLIRNLNTREAREIQKQKNENWWKSYFEKSFIHGNEEQVKYWEVIKNYQLFRYMLGCNYYGFWPTKFNGGLFTFDPILAGDSYWDDTRLEFTPDFRLWGGGSHTIQNQRLLYWPMLKSGDFEAVPQHFELYNRTLELAKKKSKEYFKIEGVMYPEQVGNYGLCNGCDNEWGNKTGLPVTQIKYLFSNSLETALMILEYHKYSGESIERYADFIKSIVLFYHNFYPENDKQDKMIMYPAGALETYHVVKNPIDAIAGLRRVLKEIFLVGEELFGEKDLKLFELIQKRIPEIKTWVKKEHEVIAYADHPSIIHNCEIPELYTVFPYGQYGIGKPDLELARDTALYAWETKEQLGHISWHPTGIQYARLGMLEECEEFLFQKMKNGPLRFQAFWGPGHDWTPDHNWGGSGMIQLQDMLLQEVDEKIFILPCWNQVVDIHFKLCASRETTIECLYKNKRVEKLIVMPEERRKNVVLPEWCKLEIK